MTSFTRGAVSGRGVAVLPGLNRAWGREAASDSRRAPGATRSRCKRPARATRRAGCARGGVPRPATSGPSGVPARSGPATTRRGLKGVPSPSNLTGFCACFALPHRHARDAEAVAVVVVDDDLDAFGDRTHRNSARVRDARRTRLLVERMAHPERHTLVDDADDFVLPIE